MGSYYAAVPGGCSFYVSASAGTDSGSVPQRRSQFRSKKDFYICISGSLCNNPADFKSLHPGQADGSGSGTVAPGSDNRLSQQQSVFYRIVCGDFFNPVFIWICKKYCAACYSRRGSFNGYIAVRNQKTKISSCIT